MPDIASSDIYELPDELLLGLLANEEVDVSDQERQRGEAQSILARFRNQPGVILGDEVGMGKTFVALAVAYSIAAQSSCGPVIIMVPANLVGKWTKDFDTFCKLYIRGAGSLRTSVARNNVDLMKILDQSPGCQIVFMRQGAMASQQNDKWIRLALIRTALRLHGRGTTTRLSKVKKNIHRFMGELLVGGQSTHDPGEELWQELLHCEPNRWKEIHNKAVRNERRQLHDDPVPQAVLEALLKIDSKSLKPLALALGDMPIRAGESHSEHIAKAREMLRTVERELWKKILTKISLRSPLLVMDEAHHLKNPGTSLARQFQFSEFDGELRTGDGTLAGTFDRMLFLTATPFQLGHRELVRVLQRFADVHWKSEALCVYR